MTCAKVESFLYFLHQQKQHVFLAYYIKVHNVYCISYVFLCLPIIQTGSLSKINGQSMHVRTLHSSNVRPLGAKVIYF